MQVTLTRRGRLAEPGRGAETYTLDDGALTTDLLAACGVDPRACIVVVNGVAHPRGLALSEGDHVQLYPAQAGG